MDVIAIYKTKKTLNEKQLFEGWTINKTQQSRKRKHNKHQLFEGIGQVGWLAVLLRDTNSCTVKLMCFLEKLHFAW